MSSRSLSFSLNHVGDPAMLPLVRYLTTFVKVSCCSMHGGTKGVGGVRRGGGMQRGTEGAADGAGHPTRTFSLQPGCFCLYLAMSRSSCLTVMLLQATTAWRSWYISNRYGLYMVKTEKLHSMR